MNTGICFFFCLDELEKETTLKGKGSDVVLRLYSPSTLKNFTNSEVLFKFRIWSENILITFGQVIKKYAA